ncbi:MAG: hypothetical protein P8N51_17850 [Pseudomonadales bacterium]|nr:hypothetical protein [Pseudomonadales bacterium]
MFPNDPDAPSGTPFIFFTYSCKDLVLLGCADAAGGGDSFEFIVILKWLGIAYQTRLFE